MATGAKTLFTTDIGQVGDATNDNRNGVKGDLDGVGRLRFDDDGTIYRWVRNYHTVALVNGNVVSHTFADVENAHKRIRDGATADFGFMAGVVRADSAVGPDSTGSAGDGDCCWIQISGYYASINILEDGSTAGVAGSVCIGVNAQVYASAAGSADIAMGTAPPYIRYIELATVTGTGGAAALNKGFIHCYAP